MILKSRILTLATALCFAAVPAIAQHSHGPGGGAASGSHGPAMGNSTSGGHSEDHTSMGAGGSSHSSASSPTTVLDRNSKLDSTLTSKLQSKGLLPAGADLKNTCSGFRSLGQCIAAIHVSHNLNVSFDCMKADMTGTAPAKGVTCPAGTGSSKLSLGKSIQALSPNTNAKTEEKTGQKQAHDDISDAEKKS